jgi:tetratricopeptide (TPR) repeat protein
VVAEAVAWSHLESFPILRGVVYAVLGNLCLREGDLGEAEEYLLKGYLAYQQLPGLPGLLFVSSCHASLARMCMDRGDHTRAEKYLREGREALKRRGLIVDTAYEMPIILALLVEVCEKREKRQEALSYLEELRNLMKSANQNWARAHYSQAAGFMASEMEEWEGALEEYEECTKYWKALARPYELAKTYQEIALVHQNMGKIETANQLFESARDIFERLGAKLDVDRALSGKKANEDSRAFSIARLRGSAKVNSKSIFDYLEDAFVADYYSEKSAPETSGWRSFVDIANHTKIPLSRFYQREAQDDGGLSELQRMGLVETRFYTGERGRGGKITRARIAYDKEEIKKHVSRRIGKISRSLNR